MFNTFIDFIMKLLSEGIMKENRQSHLAAYSCVLYNEVRLTLIPLPDC